MVSFKEKALLDAGPQSFVTGITDLDIHMRDGVPVLYAASGAAGGISAWRLGADGTPVLIDRAGYTAGLVQGAPARLEQLQTADGPVLVTLGRHETALQAMDVATDGSLSSGGFVSVAGGFDSAIVSLETVSLGGSTYAYASHWGETGLTLYQLSADGGFTALSQLQVTGGLQGADLVAIEALSLGGTQYLVTASAVGDCVSTYRVGAGGALTAIAGIGAEQGLGLDAPTALVPVQLDGRQYLVVAGGNSNSLSVLEMRGDGSLTATDHVIDSLDTRFDGITALEAITVNGQVFLVAGGADDGLSLFTLLPGGRLLHLAQIADSAATGLTNITALALHLDEAGVIQVYATGEGEAGVTWLSVDPGALAAPLTGTSAGQILTGGAQGDLISGLGGDDLLRGMGGDDILVDGAGADTLEGGAGADVFVFTRDGQADLVQGFELGIDRLDLSGLGYLRSLAQLTITSTANGALIRFGDEEIRLISADFAPIAASAFTAADLLDLDHFPLAVTAAPDPQPVSGASEGPDLIRGADDDDRLDGLGGNDTLDGGNGRDLLRGGGGDDRLLGQNGFDTLDGGAGNDSLSGGNQADRLLGGAGNDTLDGGAGRDRLFGDGGDDTALGGDGDDRFLGGAGNDSFDGGADNDRAYGQAGDDLLVGGAGDDLLVGSLGFDTLIGGTGDDTLRGRGNADVFIFENNFGNDVITDFAARNNSEKIDLSGVAAITGMTDLIRNHMTQIGRDVVIDDLGGNTITLTGVDIADLLDGNDFIF